MEMIEKRCLIEIIVEWMKNHRFAHHKVVRQEFVKGEVGTFIIFRCQVSSGCRTS